MRFYLFTVSCLLLLGGSGCAWTSSAPVEKTAIISESLSTSSTTDKDDMRFLAIKNEFTLPILLYHHIGSPPAHASADDATWYVDDHNFETMLQQIQDAGYVPLFMSEALDYIKQDRLPEKAVIVSFDDGVRDFYTHAWPLLKKYHIKATMFMMTGASGKNYLTTDQIKELDQTGLVEFQSHTRYHPYSTRIPISKLRDELVSSKKKLEDLLGKPVKALAYPFGLYNQSVINLAKEVGYEAGLTIHSGSNQEKEKLFEMRRFIITNDTNISKLLP